MALTGIVGLYNGTQEEYIVNEGYRCTSSSLFLFTRPQLISILSELGLGPFLHLEFHVEILSGGQIKKSLTRQVRRVRYRRLYGLTA